MRTDQKLKEICDNLRTNCGDMFAAARSAGVSLDFLNKWLKDDKEAAEQISEAQNFGYMGLESALITRAVRGIEEDIYYKGEVVGQKTVYSDALLKTAVEARVPAYKKGADAGGGVHVNVQVNNMPRAESYEQWLEMKKRTLEDRAGEKALLVAPVPEILQGDFKVVVDQRPLGQLEGLL